MAVNQSVVAEELLVSTAPVRDALTRLSERGLVEHINGRGFFVSRPDLSTIAKNITLMRFLVGLGMQNFTDNMIEGNANGAHGARGQSLERDLDALINFVPENFQALACSIVDRILLLERAQDNPALDVLVFRTTRCVLMLATRGRYARVMRVFDLIQHATLTPPNKLPPA
jgi:hypothetical protein